MKELILNQKAVRAAVTHNMSAPNSKTYLRSDNGSEVTIVNGQHFPSATIPEDTELIPIPALDPEGSGLETERFQDFSESPPAHTGCLSYNEASNYIDGIFDRQDYIGYAKASGWDSIEEDWLQHEEATLDFIVDQWVDDIQNGRFESFYSSQELRGEYKVKWID